MTWKIAFVAILAATMTTLPSVGAIAFMPADHVCIVDVQLPAKLACASAAIASELVTCDANTCTVQFTANLAVHGPGCGDLNFPPADACALPAQVATDEGSAPQVFQRGTKWTVYDVTSRLCVALEETYSVQNCKDLKTPTPPIPPRDAGNSLI